MARGGLGIKSLAAIVFVAVLALVLTIPVRNSDTRRPTERGMVQMPAESPPASPSPTPSRKPIPDTLRFANPYPRACLRPVDAPQDGLIAAYSRKRVTIVTTGGEARARIGEPASFVRPPLAWSPSGRVLAAGPQGLFWDSSGRALLLGDVQHGMVADKRGLWGWSPIADCGLQTDRDGFLFVTTVDPEISSRGVAVGAGASLLHRKVASFAYSPDGRSVGLVLGSPRGRAIAIADLRSNRVMVVRRFRFPTCCISLGGWTPDSRFLLYWAASGVSVAADGWPLEGVSMNGERIELTPVEGRRFINLSRVTVPRPAALETCGNRLVGVLGGARFGSEATRIATLYPRSARGAISSGNFSDVDPACSQNGELIAVARGPATANPPVQLERSLTLLDASARGGQALRNLTPGGGASEESPDWGPPGTGIVFIRRDRDVVELWFLAEGARAAQPLTLGVSLRAGAWDWSATPPTGLPAGY